MSYYKTLYQIMNKIGYEPEGINYDAETDSFFKYNDGDIKYSSIQELIFNPEFRDALYNYFEIQNGGQSSNTEWRVENIMWRLKDPVQYLSNLILGDDE